MNRTFKDLLAVGSAGERLVIKELSKITRVVDYTDYNRNKGYQQEGFDIEVFNSVNNTWERADVKTNIHNGYTFVEITNKHGHNGWLNTSSAKYIICVDIDKKQIYAYNLNDMRNHINKKKNDNTLSVKQVKDGSYGSYVPLYHKHIIKSYDDFVNYIGGGINNPSGVGVGVCDR